MTDSTFPGATDLARADKIATSVGDELDALRAERDALKAEVQRLREAGEALDQQLSTWRRAANYWYMVYKQDRGQVVTRWSSDDADDRAIKEAAKDRETLRSAAEKAKEWLSVLIGGGAMKPWIYEGLADKHGKEIREAITNLTEALK